VDILREITTLLNQPVDAIEVLGGGCVSEVFLVRLSDHRKLVVKVDESKTAGLPVEGRMLRYLAEKTSLPVPAVYVANDSILIIDYIAGQFRFSPAAERHAADLLAGLHDISDPGIGYGFEFDTLIGGLHQPNPVNSTWVPFFRDERLLYMAGEASKHGRLPDEILNRIERFCSRLDRWLSEPDRPSLIHGDVWTTNVLALGDRIVSFFDPAIYFAHNEVELAFITLFNTFSHYFFEQYQDHHPIAPGFFEERRHIYNIYPLLVHVRLFGGGYVKAVDQALARFGC
jgi:fructosamine-3-kinase